MSLTLDNGRVHALDNLRAIMMWLGIVLHVCINHLAAPSPLPWKDPQVSEFADLAVVFIHAFRMPVFFVLAGYLAAMMAHTRGVDAMLRNRVRRIALPFAVFWPIMLVLTGMLVVVIAHLMARGTIGMDLSVVPKPPPGTPTLPTMHMWFVYYLFLFCILAAAATYLPAPVKALWNRLWQALVSNWWGLIVLALPLAVVGAGYRAGVLTPSGSFIPNINELVHNGAFFAFGWSLYQLRGTMLSRYAAHHWQYLLAGCVTFGVSLKLFAVFVAAPSSVAYLTTIIAFVFGLTSWLWSVGLLGLFLKYLDRQNAVLRYISDSSYWVFLVHMLGTIGFGILLYNAPLGAGAKIVLNVLATTAVCLASYHLFVRRTWIGTLLNGARREPQPAGVAKPA